MNVLNMVTKKHTNPAFPKLQMFIIGIFLVLTASLAHEAYKEGDFKNKMLATGLVGTAMTLLIQTENIIVELDSKNKHLSDEYRYQLVQVNYLVNAYEAQYFSLMPVPISLLPAIPWRNLIPRKSSYPSNGSDKEFEGMSQAIAQHLANDKTQAQLKMLTKEACNFALFKTEKGLSESELIELESTVQFYNEVYLYLRVWLKNSIQYGVEMPLLNPAILKQAPFAEAIKFLRDYRSGYFLADNDLTNDKSWLFPYEPLEQIVHIYLDTLLRSIESIESSGAAMS